MEGQSCHTVEGFYWGHFILCVGLESRITANCLTAPRTCQIFRASDFAHWFRLTIGQKVVSDSEFFHGSVFGSMEESFQFSGTQRRKPVSTYRQNTLNKSISSHRSPFQDNSKNKHKTAIAGNF